MSALSWFAGEAAAQAYPRQIELTWQAPSVCPDRAQVLAAIDELTGGNTETEEGGKLTVEAEVLARGDKLVLHLLWRTTNGSAERTAESVRCEDLVRVTALVVALASSPNSTAGGSSSRPLREPEATKRTKREAARAPRRSAPQSSRVRQEDSSLREKPFARGHASLLLDHGSLPRTDVGMALGVSSALGALDVGGDVVFLAPQRKEVAEGAGQFWFAGVGGRACPTLKAGRISVSGCAHVELHMLRGKGQEIDFRQGGFAWFPRFGAGAELRYAVTAQLSLRLIGTGLFAPWRPTFVVEAPERILVHEPDPWAERVGFGLEFRL
ncbi:MAG TPA: hypothetical protein VFQ61_01745 [Polyangiaceae bacterium]|nr:hypothetical protein [Polyangiaceae bacterium]